jgi:Fe2+ or Zn2+ uptake regulation protein
MSIAQRPRMTAQRKVILEEIQISGTHPAADEIYDRVRQRLPRVSLGTIYRNLEVLSDCGLIRKIEMGDGHMRFDGNLRDHYHVRCTRCGRIEDVFTELLVGLEESLNQLTDYEIRGHRLDFYGLCPRCKGGS